MVLYQKRASIPWNLENLRFLFPPDDFTGSFSNPKMQERLKAMQEEKIKILLDGLEKAKDPYQALRVLNPGDHLRFLLNNIAQFEQSGLFEKSVFELFYRKNTPFVIVEDPAIWDSLFGRCDREKAAALGAPLPTEPLTIYRGSVTGIEKGYCWTTRKEEATWFLNRWQDKDMGGGTVFKVPVSSTDILSYQPQMERKEIVLTPEAYATIRPETVTRIDQL